MSAIRHCANLRFTQISVFISLFVVCLFASLSGDEPAHLTKHEQLQQRLQILSSDELRLLAEDGAVPASISALQVPFDRIEQRIDQGVAEAN